jgi:predicted transcriptional regulator
MTLQLTPALEQRLENLASQEGRPAAELAQEAIGLYLQHLEMLSAEVREAEEEADREGWLTSEQVLERIKHRFLKTA